MEAEGGTALAVVLSGSCEGREAVEALRSVHDKSYGVWPPHCNVVFPFTQPTAEAVRKVRAVAERHSAFRVRASRLYRTADSRYVELLVEDDIQQQQEEQGKDKSKNKSNSNNNNNKRKKGKQQQQQQEEEGSAVLRALHREVLEALQLKMPAGQQTYTPHITVGQHDQNTIDELLATLQADWKPMVWEVTELCMLQRQKGIYQIVHRIKLGGEEEH